MARRSFLPLLHSDNQLFLLMKTQLLKFFILIYENSFCLLKSREPREWLPARLVPAMGETEISLIEK